MNADRRARADALLRDALDLPAEDREAFVRQAAGGDAALVAEVRALLTDALSDHTSLAPGSALAGAFGGALLRRFDGGSDAAARVGPFRVLREIGRGGMGVVYLGERVDGGFTQQVALKIAAPGAASDALARRFERERQIVASLDHPHIARLVDGGRTEDGRPYFAMEFVDGERIDQHCDRLRLDIDARLALVRTVAAAVQHAHSRLLVHRDIKPGNIMISRAGEVKLLDFGIAKPIGRHPEAGAEPLTRTDVRPMTPEYASPEMVRGEPATTASDVYQLGLLLYELLTGMRAQSLSGATATDAERIVCEADPPLPSAAALGRSSGDGPSSIPAGAAEARAAARATTPAALARRLAGDLDAIVMQAIRKEPEARYATPLDLADDLQRSLASEPVRARRGTTLYRARKFVRRNRVATAFAATVLALLVGFGAWMTVLYGRASANLARARAAETSAAHEAETARQVSDFLVRLFGVSDPGEARGNTVTARALLDDAAERIGPELESQPEVQARLMQVMGQVYINLGLYDAAEPLLRDALALVERTSGAGSVPAAEALDSLGTLAVVRGAPGEGEPYHRKALAIREAIGPADGVAVTKSLTSLGSCLIEQARYAEAEPLLRRALDIRERVLPPDSADISASLNELAEVYNRQARYAEAEPLYLRALAISEKTLGPNHPDLGYKFNNLGLLYKRMGRLDEAEALYRRALAVREKVLPPDHPLIAWTLDNLGMLYMTQKRYADAEPLFTRALDIAGRAVGPDHPDTAIIMNNLALLRAAQGRTAEATGETQSGAPLRSLSASAASPT